MASYAETLDHNAAVRRGHGKKAVLDHLRMEEAENGGHVIEHHFESNGAYKEPETHVFAAHTGTKPQVPEGHVLHHIAKHMGIPHEVIGKEEHEPDADDQE